jgi:hypothetical protein
MKTTQKNSIVEYQFENHRLGIRATIVGNLSMLAIFLYPNLGWSDSPFPFFCLVSGLFILIINLFYNWRNFGINILVTILYIAIYWVEIAYYGIPEQVIKFNSTMNKGILFQLMIYSIPFMYSIIRLGFVFPLLQICFTSAKLDKEP